jgi:hypothetical protein
MILNDVKLAGGHGKPRGQYRKLDGRHAARLVAILIEEQRARIAVVNNAVVEIVSMGAFEEGIVR